MADLNLELIPFERPVWMARLGQTIGAVLSITQWSMVLFADAYVPYLGNLVINTDGRMMGSCSTTNRCICVNMCEARVCK